MISDAELARNNNFNDHHIYDTGAAVMSMTLAFGFKKETIIEDPSRKALSEIFVKDL
jgi:hypothetical protein